MNYTVGSLYAGVGGICLGFKQAGFKLNWANEVDKNACITYRNNFNHKLYEDDVLTLDPNLLGKIDVLTAGFPCQPFSLAGYRKGFEDERGNHFSRILYYMDALKPKVVFLENVKNLASHDKGNTFKVIKESIIAKGYSFKAKVLNTKDYGNIPHNRERIFIICFKNEEDGSNKYIDNFDFPNPETLTKKIENVVGDEIVSDKFYYREDRPMFNDLVKDMTRSNTVYQWRRQYVRENKSDVCPTLTANMGTGGHNVPLVLRTNGIRKLTPEECFELQGFPVFNGKYQLPTVALSHLYKQAGNSVSVPVIKRLSDNIKIVLDGGKILNSENQTELPL